MHSFWIFLSLGGSHLKWLSWHWWPAIPWYYKSPLHLRYKNHPDLKNKGIHIHWQNARSLKNQDELLMVTTASTLRMSDAQRLQAIDRIYKDVQDKPMFLRKFNGSVQAVSSERTIKLRDAKAIEDLYGKWGTRFCAFKKWRMKKCVVKIIFLSGCFIGFPGLLWAQDDDTFHELQHVLDNLYEQMIPLCKPLMDVGRGIAGIAATWYIGTRVWGQ